MERASEEIRKELDNLAREFESAASEIERTRAFTGAYRLIQGSARSHGVGDAGKRALCDYYFAKIKGRTEEQPQERAR